MKSLVKRAQRGDDQAFMELIEENKQAMYKVAVSILKNDSDAADAIQEKAGTQLLLVMISMIEKMDLQEIL